MQASAPNDDAERLLSAGISALRAGDNARARDLLGQAIRHNPRDELAWLWLSGAVETDAEQRQCLERVLTLNPHNVAARNGLDMLAAAAINAPVAPVTPPADAPTNPPVAAPAARLIAPTPVVAPPPLTPPADIRAEPAAVDSLASLRPTSPRSRLNPRLVAAIALVSLMVVIGAIVVAPRFGGPSSASQPTAAAIAVAATATPPRLPTPRLPTPTRAPQTATATPPATPSATAAPTSTPSAADQLVLQGLAKAQSKEYQGAIVLYNQALARDPQNAEAFFQRGQARDGLGEPQSAIKNYTLALQINPNHGAAYSARGDARLKLKDRPGALDDYRHAADIYTSTGDTERAKVIAAKIKALQ